MTREAIPALTSTRLWAITATPPAGWDGSTMELREPSRTQLFLGRGAGFGVSLFVSRVFTPAPGSATRMRTETMEPVAG